jgi:hypothetical protein
VAAVTQHRLPSNPDLDLDGTWHRLPTYRDLAEQVTEHPSPSNPDLDLDGARQRCRAPIITGRPVLLDGAEHP